MREKGRDEEKGRDADRPVALLVRPLTHAYSPCLCLSSLSHFLRRLRMCPVFLSILLSISCPRRACACGIDELYNDDTLAHLQDSGFVGHWGGRCKSHWRRWWMGGGWVVVWDPKGKDLDALFTRCAASLPTLRWPPLPVDIP